MHLFSLPIASLQLLSLTLAVSAQLDYGGYTCPPEGPKIPRPINLASSVPLKAALQSLTKTIDAALNGTIKPGWVVQNASFSVAFVSMADKKPLWEYHHRGSNFVEGAKVVDGDTQYHIGSLSKLVTDIMLLRSGIDMGKPITQYVPELNKPNTKIKWSEITVSSLASHLAGIPGNYGFSDHYSLQQKLEAYGFPKVPKDAYPPCGVDDLNEKCTKDDILKGMMTLEPVANPNRRVGYSGLAFTLLSYALSGFSGGKSYNKLLDELLVSPFKLGNTGAMPGNTSRAVVPNIGSWWGRDVGEETPASGLYSSSNDLGAILHSILNRSLLNDATILRWLKPTVFMNSIQTLSGMPWEIYRHLLLTPRYPQFIDVYSKGGSSYGYNSQVSLIDQYGVGMVWLGAGDAFAALLLPDITMAKIIPALEEEARMQAQATYMKSYASKGNSTMEVKLKFRMDAGPGLIIQNMTRGPHNLLAALPIVYMESFGNLTKIPMTLSPVVRLYPTDMSAKGTIEGREVIKEDWRIKWDPVLDITKWNGTGLVGEGAPGDECSSWVNADWSNYAGQSIEKVVFIKDPATSKVLGVELPWLRTYLPVEA